MIYLQSSDKAVIDNVNGFGDEICCECSIRNEMESGDVEWGSRCMLRKSRAREKRRSYTECKMLKSIRLGRSLKSEGGGGRWCT